MTTPVYGIKYIPVGGPAYLTRQYLEDNANTIEAALIAGGLTPPGASDYASLVGRVTTLEVKTAPAEVTYPTGWARIADTTAQLAGVQYWRRGSLVTVAGGLQTTSARAAQDIAFTLPTGFRPPATVDLRMSNGATFSIRTDGTCKTAGAVATATFMSFSVSYGAA